MQINEDEVVSKRKVGHLGKEGVVEIGLKGGLFLIFAKVHGKIRALGSGSHRAIAKFLARKAEPTIEWTELSKSDHAGYDDFKHLLPKYEALTAEYDQALLKRQG